MLYILLAAGSYVGWNIGANDTANCVGTTIGAGLISFRRAVLLVAVFSFLGAVFQGQHVMKTIGKGIVRTDLDYRAILVALICSGFFVTLATFFRIPTSTSQAIVGGVVGVGLAAGADVDFSKFIIIVESWLICPLLIMALAYALSHLLRQVLRRIRANTIFIQNALGWMTIFASCYMAYSMGANNAGNAVGPIANLEKVSPTLLLLLGGLAIAVGAITYGRRVSETVGKGITPLDIPGAFVAQISSAFGLHLFSLFGLPVSTFSAIVGAVAGVGLVRGAKTINKKTIVTILSGWGLTPCLSAGASFLLYRGIEVVLK